jgi:alkylation response protein AidB-like acyl-CoA dehydrogenase
LDLSYSPEDRAFRDATRRWFAAHTPREELKTLDERRAWHRMLHEAGFVGMSWPREYGGRAASPMEQAIAADQMRSTRFIAGERGSEPAC